MRRALNLFLSLAVFTPLFLFIIFSSTAYG